MGHVDEKIQLRRCLRAVASSIALMGMLMGMLMLIPYSFIQPHSQKPVRTILRHTQQSFLYYIDSSTPFFCLLFETSSLPIHWSYPR